MSKGKFCPHCGARNITLKSCMTCGKDINTELKGKNASWLMKNIGKVRFITFLLILLLGLCSFFIEKFYQTLGSWKNIITITGYIILILFIVFFIILLRLGNKNYDDSSEELSEYKKKHTNTFIDK